jgi:DNA polymerase (family 10)
MRDRFYIASSLREIGRLLALKGENPFKARAYERGARALENLEDDFDALVKTRRLTDVQGIGSALASVIEEIHSTGECWALGRLRDELPPGTVELSAVPGLNLKKIIALHDDLRVESIGDLKTACVEGLVRTVKGFGQKTEAKILAAVESLERRGDRVLLNHASNEAERLLRHLRAAPEVLSADLAGSLRRRKETVRRISIVAGSDRPKAVVNQFLRFPAILRSEEREPDHWVALLPGGLYAELHVASPSDYVSSLHYWTGSQRHLARLGELARSKGLSIGPRGLNEKKGEAIQVSHEQEIYQRLEMQYVPPELREDEGEIEAAVAGTLPNSLALADIHGMTHCHTVYSDGQNSIEEMALAAEAIGMQYLTITDHSPSAFYARGVDIDRLLAQWDEMARVQEKVKIKLLKGTESDITTDGLLDYPDSILERFDIIITSIHARHKMDSDQMTRRLLRALQLPWFKVWGHPLGRLIQSRPPFDCRMEEVLDVVAESRAAIEINGDPHRLDLEPRWIRQARRRGIKFIVSTDAHSTRGLGNLQYGVAMARRGWLAREDVLNALSTEEFMKAVHP